MVTLRDSANLYNNLEEKRVVATAVSNNVLPVESYFQEPNGCEIECCYETPRSELYRWVRRFMPSDLPQGSCRELWEKHLAST